MSSPDPGGSAAARALAGLSENVRRHLEETVLPLCGWNPAVPVSETIPDWSGIRLAFFRKNLRRGGSARVMVEQLAALQPTGAAADVYTFEPGVDPALAAEIRGRCPAVRRMRRVSRRLAAWDSLAWESGPRRHDLFVTTDIQDPLIYAGTLAKLGLPPPRVAALMHEEYARYLEFLKPHAARLSAVCLDYDFTGRLRAVYGPALPAAVVAPLFPPSAEPPFEAGRLRGLLGIPEGDRVLAYAGRLDRNKQIERLADLLETLLEEGRENVWLLLAGRWEDEAYRREVAARFNRATPGRRLRLLDRVRDAGPLASLAPVYAAADLFVFASRVEGFYPLVILEAQLAGLPVVCTGAGGLGRAILDGVTGYQVPTEAGPEGVRFGAQSHTVFVDRVRALLEDPALRARIGAAGREAVSFLTTHYPFAPLFRKWIGSLLTREDAR
jgi:glycosyltransferase involved in cell wall biosynthesis